ncbi:MAG TPA: flagellar protein FlaG [Steroidobacteraceae bacterium]|nr:flagellar protein FlaG [Steroidobacteraceae bacterium]
MTEDIGSISPLGGTTAADLGTGGSGSGGASSGAAFASSGSAGGPGGAKAGAGAAAASANTSAGSGSSTQDLQSAVQQINGHLAGVNRVMELHVDAASGVTVATIKDAQTGEVLQQVPSEGVLELAAMLSGWSPGERALLDLIA